MVLRRAHLGPVHPTTIEYLKLHFAIIRDGRRRTVDILTARLEFITHSPHLQEVWVPTKIQWPMALTSRYASGVLDIINGHRQRGVRVTSMRQAIPLKAMGSTLPQA